MGERRVGYVGKSNIPTGAAWMGLLHLESEPLSFESLCGRRLTMASAPGEVLEDSLIKKLNICKRCQAKGE